MEIIEFAPNTTAFAKLDQTKSVLWPDTRPEVMGIPGLKIATAASPEAGYGILKAMIRDDGPGILCAGDPNGRQRGLAQWVQCRKPLFSS